MNEITVCDVITLFGNTCPKKHIFCQTAVFSFSYRHVDILTQHSVDSRKMDQYHQIVFEVYTVSSYVNYIIKKYWFEHFLTFEEFLLSNIGGWQSHS